MDYEMCSATEHLNWEEEKQTTKKQWSSMLLKSSATQHTLAQHKIKQHHTADPWLLHISVGDGRGPKHSVKHKAEKS